MGQSEVSAVATNMSMSLLTSCPGWRLATSLARTNTTHINAINKVTTCTIVPGRGFSLAGSSNGNAASNKANYSISIQNGDSSNNLVTARTFSTSLSRRSEDEVAAEKAAAEKAAAEKVAAEKAAAKAAAEKAAAEKAAAEKAAAKKAAAEKAAAEKAAAEKAAADKAAEEIAIRNMKDPIQELFLTAIRAYSGSGGIGSADAATQAELKHELERVAKQYGGAEGEDMTKFPELSFKDVTVDPINISEKQ